MILVSLLNEAVTSNVYIGIGSNVDRKKNILTALKTLEKEFGKLQTSKVYESAAMGIKNAHNYYNLVVGFETLLPPEDINKQLKKIENNFGRRQKRLCPLDLDLLLHGDLITHKKGLDIPRKDIIDYAYVAVPLSEVVGDQTHPETGKTFYEHSQSDNIVDQKLWLAKFQLIR